MSDIAPANSEISVQETMSAPLPDSQLYDARKNADADLPLEASQLSTPEGDTSKEAPTFSEPQTQREEIVFGMVDRIVELEQERRGIIFTQEDIDEMKKMSFSELNRHLIELAKETVNTDTGKNPNGYQEGSENQAPNDLSKEKTVEELATADQLKKVRDEQNETLYGKDGIVTQSFLDMKRDPEKYGLDPAAFAEGATLGMVLDEILKKQMDHKTYEYRKRNNIPLDQELTAEQNAELQGELEIKRAEFQEQKNTLMERAKGLGIDMGVSSWEHTDFSTILQTFFAMDGYSQGHSALFSEDNHEGKTSVTVTSFKEKIGLDPDPQEAKIKWITLFEYIALSLPETQRNKLTKPDEWHTHTDTDQIMKDMKEFYAVIVSQGQASQTLANNAFTTGFEEARKEMSLKGTFGEKESVSKDLMTCIQSLGERRDYFNNFFGDVKG
jgi:hypothetical protein